MRLHIIYRNKAKSKKNLCNIDYHTAQRDTAPATSTRQPVIYESRRTPTPAKCKQQHYHIAYRKQMSSGRHLQKTCGITTQCPRMQCVFCRSPSIACQPIVENQVEDESKKILPMVPRCRKPAFQYTSHTQIHHREPYGSKNGKRGCHGIVDHRLQHSHQQCRCHTEEWTTPMRQHAETLSHQKEEEGGDEWSCPTIVIELT